MKNSEEYVARQMTAAAFQASTIVEKTSKKYKLSQADSDEIMVAAVVNHLVDDGNLNKQHVRDRVYEFVGHLSVYVSEVLGVKFEGHDNITEIPKN